MKKLLMILPLALTLCFMVGCRGKKANVEKFMEDGVEVVLNFSLSENKSEYPVLSPILSIDTEDDELAEYGLSDIWGFDVNSSGGIFIFNHPLSQEGLILKFDGTGDFIKSFGRKGQGPGEIQLPLYQKINLINEVSVLDFGGQKLIVFDEFGDIVREIKPEIRIFDRGILLPLTNGNYLYRNLEMDESRKSISLVLFLIDSKFEENTIQHYLKEKEGWKSPKNYIIAVNSHETKKREIMNIGKNYLIRYKSSKKLQLIHVNDLILKDVKISQLFE